MNANNNKRKAIIGTVLFHLLLLMVLIFFGLKYPEPLPEQGILINFGTADEGFGNIQPEEVTSTETSENTYESAVESSPAETVEESAITQKVKETIAVKKNTPVNIEKKIIEEEKEPEPVVNPNALYTGKTSNANKTSEGVTKEGGDQGKIDGTPESKNYGEHGSKGTGFILAGRELVFKPKIEETTQETGKVVVNIWVDRYGKVTRATPGAKGSTTTNTYLYNIAREAAIKAKFSAKPDAPEEQKGTIVFEFRLKE